MVSADAPARAAAPQLREGRSSPGKVFSKSFCKSQFPHESVNLSFILVMIKDQLMDLCGYGLVQNELINSFDEINLERSARLVHALEVCVESDLGFQVQVRKKRTPYTL